MRVYVLQVGEDVQHEDTCGDSKRIPFSVRTFTTPMDAHLALRDTDPEVSWNEGPCRDMTHTFESACRTQWASITLVSVEGAK